MSASKIIKQLMIERNMHVKDVAEKLGINSQSMSNRLYRDTYTVEDFQKICDILGADVVVVLRDTGKTFKD